MMPTNHGENRDCHTNSHPKKPICGTGRRIFVINTVRGNWASRCFLHFIYHIYMHDHACIHDFLHGIQIKLAQSGKINKVIFSCNIEEVDLYTLPGFVNETRISKSGPLLVSFRMLQHSLSIRWCYAKAIAKFHACLISKKEIDFV